MKFTVAADRSKLDIAKEEEKETYLFSIVFFFKVDTSMFCPLFIIMSYHFFNVLMF
jgi:hypothetical protein